MISQGQAAGTTSAALMMGSTDPATTVCEEYDGTSWAASASVSTARYGAGGAGTTSLAIMVGGGPPGNGVVTVEEYTGASPAATVSTIDFD